MNLSLKNIISDVSWSDIELKILSIYPEEQDSLQFYKRLYWELNNLEPDENPNGIKINFDFFDEEEDVFYETDTSYIDSDLTDFMFELSTEQWKKILGYHISVDLLEDMDKAEIITHAFLEANYGGFQYAENNEILNLFDDE